MKCRRTALECEVVKYETDKNLEDGFELFSDVVTKGWIIVEHILKVTFPDGRIMCPYISHRRGKTFINVNDYIVLDSDGTKHVCGEDKVWHRFEKLENEPIGQKIFFLPFVLRAHFFLHHGHAPYSNDFVPLTPL